MLNPVLDALPDSPFTRMNALIADVTPPADPPPLLMSVGEPQNAYPAYVAETLTENAHLWGKYVSPRGTDALNAAMIGWLERRFGLPPGTIRAGESIAPLAGTREGLYLLPEVVTPRTVEGSNRPPAVLIPNPFYHTYAGAALTAGAEPVFLHTTRETNYLPDLEAVSPEMWARTSLFYLCSPSNPAGSVADLDYLKRAITLAREYDFCLVVDECYAELYYGAPPPSALNAALALDGTLDNVVVFHSLSKRSSLAGLRAGFCAGDPRILQPFMKLRDYGAVFIPLPSQAAAARLWADDDHVAVNRAYYRRNFEIAETYLGDLPGFAWPEAGFFLWLEVGADAAEPLAKRLWAEAGVKVVPGAYFGRADAGGFNPGAPYLRLAMVHDAATTEAAMARIRPVLSGAAEAR
ncbi:aminotransferase class I/II-fold pyridoxal phosphate-dependent enzyme [Roseospira navarrensis]|uniref:Aminotransferase n=1 Tax=Roseospira navarrensis TaxID=140058 RepID=A0A7X1ZC99_9PROT|nr:aminotransferase class I/II-fold pyridoxal phosphate-dependent enzyme [Roseospira navarrensis]MQX35909.1 aminotransferase class I/II-fold pyridoxal phosphate-dependent enzyme [Roseospira navarrensis]